MQNVYISSESIYDSVVYDSVKLGCWSRNQPITRPGIKHCDWFILPLLLATATMQFSLNLKRRSHERPSDSVGFIFNRSYCSPSLVKTSAYQLRLFFETEVLRCSHHSNLRIYKLESRYASQLIETAPKRGFYLKL